ncbi:hypothetical protein J437_LFUL017221 [Ladona fulva]|uniref:Autocrine motility factor receptor n=1 Tax=Ladona fulva TaxID=123851 RepID=A0A8K0P7L9_LADFU|nr:hypothetical protein J437_LFUL017221 [Ladona fulva]
MPVIFLDRLPLPNLRTYVTVSVLLLTSSVFYAAEVTSDPEWKNNLTAYSQETRTARTEKNDSSEFVTSNGIVEEIIPKRFRPREVVAFMIRDPLCIWSLINGAYCCLILLGKVIQGAVFGELRVSEQQHVRDKFWNFLFYKFIFVFGVMNVQHLDDVLLWCSWFSLLGALQLLTLHVMLRYGLHLYDISRHQVEVRSHPPLGNAARSIPEDLSTLNSSNKDESESNDLASSNTSPTNPSTTWMKLKWWPPSSLMSQVWAHFESGCAFRWFGRLFRPISQTRDNGNNGRGGLFCWLRRCPRVSREETSRNGNGSSEGRRESWFHWLSWYHVELWFELGALILDAAHHLHMLLWANVFLSMASLVICMQLRYLAHEVRRRLQRHRNYLCLSFSPTTPRWSHIRLMSLLASILVFSWGLLALSAAVGVYLGLNTFAFMAAECLLLSIRTLHVMLRYGLHLYDISRHQVEVRSHPPLGNAARSIPEDLSTLNSSNKDESESNDLASSNTSPTNPSTTWMKLKWWPPSSLMSQVWAHFESGCAFRWFGRLFRPISQTRDNGNNGRGGLFCWLRRCPRVSREETSRNGNGSSEGRRESWFHWLSWYHVELWFELGALILDAAHHLHMLLWANVFFYPMATEDDLSANSDNCAICWEKMESARKLPCSHLFHDSCLQSWLEQDASCPTCRLALRIESGRTRNGGVGREMGVVPVEEDMGTGGLGMVGAGGRIVDGSRYVSWLPSFSVEVTHTQLLQFDDHPRPASTSQLDSMARQIQQLFPRMPLHTLVEDLRDTHSIELTVENVLDGRLLPPPATLYHVQPPTPPSSPVNSQSNPTILSPNLPDPNSQIGNEPSNELQPGGSGLNGSSRFSKSSSEREKILQQRKERLVATARRRYLEKHPPSSGLGPPEQQDANTQHHFGESSQS